MTEDDVRAVVIKRPSGLINQLGKAAASCQAIILNDRQAQSIIEYILSLEDALSGKPVERPLRIMLAVDARDVLDA